MGNELDNVTFDELQQKLVDYKIGEAREKERAKALADFAAQADKDKAEAERSALVAQEQWKELAEQHAARVGELEPLVAEVEGYQKMVEGMLKDRIGALGDKAKKAVEGLPGNPTDLERLAWLNANAENFKAVVGDGVGTPAPSKKKLKGDKPVKLCSVPLRA